MRPQPVPLSQLIDIVNERFGTDFNPADQLFFDQIVEAAVADDALRQAAAVNPGDKFELVFKNLLENLFVERMDQNEEILRPVHERRVLPEDRDDLDGVGSVPAAAERRLSRRSGARAIRHTAAVPAASRAPAGGTLRDLCPARPPRGPPRAHSATPSTSTTRTSCGP